MDYQTFIRWNQNHTIGIFADINGTADIYKFVNKSYKRRVELFEIFELIFDGSINSEKYRKIKMPVGFPNYFIMILSRYRTSVCILCKEKIINRIRFIIMIKLFKGLPEDVVDYMIDMVIEKGGYDYEFKTKFAG